MSVSISIYIPIKSVSYITGMYETLKRNSYSIKYREDYIANYFKNDVNSDSDLVDLYLFDLYGHFTDETIQNKDTVTHDTLHLFNTNKDVKNNRRANKEIKHILNTFKEYVQRYNSIHIPHKYIVVDEIAYRQGNFLKKWYYKRQNTIFYATDKKTAYRIMETLFNCSNEAREAKIYFSNILETLEDNTFIFEVSY